jgi:GNAT superfamily N-acetyltransferase
MKAVSRHFRASDRIIIRRAKPPDAATITRFNAAMGWETEGILLDKSRLHKGVKAILRDPTKGFYLVAETKGKMVGQIMITREWSDWRNGYFWWIQSVYVRSPYRRHGIYRALHEYVVDAGRKRKDICGIRLYVDRHNSCAQKVYKKLGMKRSNYEMFEEDFLLRRDK